MSQVVQVGASQKVNMTQAAKLAGVSRNTLHRHVQKGKVSKEIDGKGSPVISIAELERVYGTLTGGDSNDTAPKLQHDTPNNDSVLQVELKFLREQVEDLKTERDKLLHVIAEQAGTVKMLTDQRQRDTRSFWQRLMGKG
jgi:hypothetical protein